MFKEKLEKIKTEILLLTGVPKKYIGAKRLESFAEINLKLGCNTKLFVDRFVLKYFGYDRN